MKQIIKTNERCYICDFRRATSGIDEEDGSIDDSVIGLYQDGLCKVFTGVRGRFVYLHPVDRKPVCSDCSRVIRSLLVEHFWTDRNFEKVEFGERPPDLTNHQLQDPLNQIDWSRIETWDNGNIHFPLPKKPEKNELTDELKKQISEFAAKTCKPGVARGIGGRDYYLRTAPSGTLDDHWRPLEEKARLARTSEWPKELKASGQDSLS